jgi:hypothetical protein
MHFPTLFVATRKPYLSHHAAAGGWLADQYKLVIHCPRRAALGRAVDAIDRGDGTRLAELLKGVECRALDR